MIAGGQEIKSFFIPTVKTKAEVTLQVFCIGLYQAGNLRQRDTKQEESGGSGGARMTSILGIETGKCRSAGLSP